MIFQWNRASGEWELVGVGGETLGIARREVCPVPAGIGGTGWTATMRDGRSAWSRDLGLIRTWMIRNAGIARAER